MIIHHLLLLVFLRFLLIFWLLIAHGYLLSDVKVYSKYASNVAVMITDPVAVTTP